MSFSLTLIEPTGRITTTIFDQDEVTIGRSSSNHFRPDPALYSQISRQHGTIVRRGDGQFLYEDLGSTQGSWIDGKEIKGRILLNREDTIMLGRDGPSVSISWAKERITGQQGTHYRMFSKPSPAFPLAFSPHFLGEYFFYERVGAGGFGEVWRAVPYDQTTKSRAIKLMHPALMNPDALTQEDRQSLIQRFAREAEVTYKLSTSGAPGIIPVHSWGDDADRDYLFLVMDYIEGEAFDRIIRRGEFLSVPQACNYMYRVALGLDAAHSFEFVNENGLHCRGIVHRDIKPGNLLIEAATDSCWIVDFGVAGFLEGGERLTCSNMAVGTHLYLPPEALESKFVKPASDLWGFSMTLYLALSAGNFPYQAAEGGIIRQKVQADEYLSISRFRVDVPPVLVDALARSLHPDPERRIQTAREWAALLHPLAYS